MLDALKLKEFQLEPVLAAWKDGPVFRGEPKKDLPVDEWLKAIKSGCVARNIPEEHWHRVGRHFLGRKAAARFEELKRVMAQVNGGKFRWTWKKFKAAMRNMGWNIDSSVTETIEVHSKPSGVFWRVLGKNNSSSSSSPPEASRPSISKNAKTDSILPSLSKVSKTSSKDSTRPIPVKSKTTDSSFWLKRTATKKGSDEKEKPSRPVVVRAATIAESPISSSSSSFWPLAKKNSGDEKSHRPGHSKAASDSVIPRKGGPAVPASEAEVTTVAQAPKWLIDACGALDFLSNEHPKVMSFISAVLVTVGSIPAIPAVAAGAGGAVLASGTAQAVGAVAVGLGSWMNAQQSGNVQTEGGGQKH